MSEQPKNEQSQVCLKGIVQSVIAIGAVVAAFFSPYLGINLPDYLQNTVLLVVGFYFGRKA